MDFHRSNQTREQSCWAGRAASARGGWAGSASPADFPTLPVIPFYRCSDKRCQGLSNDGKGASLASWETLPSYGGSLLDTAAGSRTALGPDTREHLGAILRNKILQKSPRAGSTPLSSKLAQNPAKHPQGREKGPANREGMSGSNRRGKSQQNIKMGSGPQVHNGTAPGRSVCNASKYLHWHLL